jgi:phosphinothricin tripeptide acetyl hydrolase
MRSQEIQAVRNLLAELPDMETLTIEETRVLYDQLAGKVPMPENTFAENKDADGVKAEWLQFKDRESHTVIFYLHGGGYIIGSPDSHRHMVAAICEAADAAALIVDYRLAPENPFPAAVNDAITAYKWLLDQGTSPQQIVIAGDSAGGGLTIATLVSLRDEGIALPAAAVCISPWVDLTNSAESYKTKAESDPMLKKARLDLFAQSYLQGQMPAIPLASPVFADLEGLPPILIQVGTDEVLFDDAKNLEDRARKAGLDVTLQVWDDMIHVWHYFFPVLTDGREAIARIGEFVKAKIGQKRIQPQSA